MGEKYGLIQIINSGQWHKPPLVPAEVELGKPQVQIPAGKSYCD